jgi:hypothetical protein
VTLTHLSTSQFPEQGVFRVSRREDPLSFSRINVADAELSQAGNRFDVPGGAVLYCSSTLKGSFAETLAHFRPSPAVVAALSAEPNSIHMNPGSVPTDWRLQRVKLRVTCVDPLPFLDAEHPRTIAALNKYLAKDLVAIGVDEPLDVSMVRGRNRQLTRLISRWPTSNKMTKARRCLVDSATYPNSVTGSAGPSMTGLISEVRTLAPSLRAMSTFSRSLISLDLWSISREMRSSNIRFAFIHLFT